MTNSNLISVVVVSYNSAEYLERTLRSLYALNKNHFFETIMVDNNSSDNSVDIVRRKFPQVRIIQNTKNYGFAYANNQAFKVSRNKYIVSLNPDVEFTEVNVLEKCFSFMEANKQAAACTCTLLNEDGSVQPSIRNYPRLVWLLMRGMTFGRMNLFKGIENRYFVDVSKVTSPMKIDWAIGAFLFFRKESLEQVGFYDTRYFLYYEDVDLCLRLNQSGYDIFFLPDLKLRHQYRRASATLFSKASIHHAMSILRFFRRHYRDL